MPKIATKAADNVWCKARYRAAEWNDRLASREGAAMEAGIERTRLANIELDNIKPYPEEANMMAETYHAPELRNYYCRECCPLGKNMPKVDEESLDRITVRALHSMGRISDAREQLLAITQDGTVSDDERPGMLEIISLLDDLNEINQNLRVWLEKNQEG